MNFFLLLIIYCFFIFIISKYLISYFKEYELFIDNDFIKPQAIHTNKVPRALGLTFLFFIFIFYVYDFSAYLITIIIVSIICSLPGFFEDLNISISPFLRFFYQIFILIFSIFIFKDIQILRNLEFLPSYLNINIFLMIFTIIAIVTIVNAFNFIDGLDGLLILYSITIITFFYLFTFNEIKNNFLILFISHLLLILYFNFPKSIAFLGDFGAYFIGFFISFIFIYYHNNFSNMNIMINDWFFANLLAYPAFEILSTVLRRIKTGKSPFYPDNKHTHSILYNILKSKTNLKNSYNTSIILNLLIVILLTPLFFLGKDSWIFYFFTQILIFFIIREIFLLISKRLNI